ncbi:MAG: hypothetical protein ABWK01_01375 [Infirmifilum sp.]
MGEERVKTLPSFTEEINIRVILEEQRKAEARIAEAKKIADELLARAREQAKSIMAKAQEVSLDEDVKKLLEEERRKYQESLKSYEEQELRKLETVKKLLDTHTDDLKRMLLQALLG